jgi:positive regulator of sigma E activity
MPLIVLLIVAALVVDFFWLLAALVVTVVVARLIGWWLARRDDRSIAERQRRAELCARADRQHAAVLAGDERGVYGEYPPAV